MYLEKVQEELERERSSRGQVEGPSNVPKEGEEEILDTKRSETSSTCSITCENAYKTLKDRVAHLQRNNEL